MDNAIEINGSLVAGQGLDSQILAFDREDVGLAALDGLSLEELGVIAAREIGETRRLQAEAVVLSRRSTVTLYRAGRTLWCARKKLKGKGKRAWTRWQKANGIPTTSAWQAIRLYEEAESEQVLAGLTRKQALERYGIAKPKKVHPHPAPVPVVPDPAPPESPDLQLFSGADGSVGRSVQTGADMEGVQAGGEPEAEPDPATPPAAETLLLVVRRLEILEQDSRGGDLGDEAHALIERAIATLRRLRGEVTPETDAA